MKTIRRWINSRVGPRWWQVYRQHQTTHLSYIRCEHRYKWIAVMCAGIKPNKGLWFYEVQCRAGCAECFAWIRRTRAAEEDSDV